MVHYTVAFTLLKLKGTTHGDDEGTAFCISIAYRETLVCGIDSTERREPADRYRDNVLVQREMENEVKNNLTKHG